ILGPQRSTLFPYTTLFRSLAAAEADAARAEQTVSRHRVLVEEAHAHANTAQQACAAMQARWQERLADRKVGLDHLQTSLAQLWRSEEHTSELQSQSNLVCR